MNTFQLILLNLSAVTFIILAFLYLRQKHYRVSGMMASFAFLSFFFIQVAGTGLFGTQHITAEQILCWIFGFLFLCLAAYFAHKDSLAYSLVILVMSAFSVFCGLSSVQTFLKTGMLMKVVDTLDEYGKKLDGYQTNVIEMRNQLSDQQDFLKSNQLSLASNIINMKKDFSDHQTSLGQQMGGFENLVNQQGNTLRQVSTSLQNAENTILGQQLTNAAQFLSISMLQSCQRAVKTSQWRANENQPL
jgi:hypothetical protein